jgi:predicted amidohydrolase
MNAKTNKEANLNTFASYMKEASEKGAHLVIFPEISLQQNPGWGRSSYQPTDEELTYLHDTAETIPGKSTKKMIDTARRLNIFVVFGMTEKSLDGKLYNSSVFLGPDGIIGKYRKRHLWDSERGGNEHLSWLTGTETGVFDSPLGKVGLMICIEMWHNIGLKLAEMGADFLVTVSAWPSSSGDIFEDVTIKNALEAGRWHFVSNQVGSVGHAIDYGHSRIVAPSGVVVGDTGGVEGMVIVETNIFIDASLT